MRALRIIFQALSAIFVVFGFSSCSKTETDPCIECTYTSTGVPTEVTKYCKSRENDWKGYANTWEEFVTYIKAVDALSSTMSCKEI